MCDEVRLVHVEKIMASPVKTIDKDQVVSVALDTMDKLGISAIPVTEGKQLIGLITEKALLLSYPLSNILLILKAFWLVKRIEFLKGLLYHLPLPWEA